MAVLRSHTRHAGLLASLIALPLLALPQPTHASERLMLEPPAKMLATGSPASSVAASRH